MSVLDRKKAPETRDFGILSIPRPRFLRLDNGIPLTVLDSGEQQVNRLSLVWDGGTAEIDRPSVATLTVNMLREGANKYSGAEISELLEYNGAWLKGNVHSHHTSLVSYTLNSKVDNVFPVLSEIITTPVFPEKEMSVLRAKMAQTAELDREKVEFYSAMEMRRMVMGNEHPLAHSDSPEEIKGISVNDLKHFHARVFNPASCGMYLAGRITPEIEDSVNRYFGGIKTSGSKCRLNIVDFCASHQRKSVIHRSDALQSAIRMSIPTISRTHDDYIPLRIAVAALGGYFGSRLMSNIREDKGYTYGITSSLLGYLEGGIVSIGTQCDNKYVDLLINEVQKEMGRMSTVPLSAEETDRLKKYMTAQLAEILDSPFSIMDHYENMRLTSIPADYFERQLTEIRNITPQRIMDISRKYLNFDDIYISIAGNV